jgi:hypothetical protein
LSDAAKAQSKIKNRRMGLAKQLSEGTEKGQLAVAGKFGGENVNDE